MQHRGVVRRVLPESGYGFIAQESGDDLFFHLRDMADDSAIPFQRLWRGDVVTYEIGQGTRGRLAAVNVSATGEQRHHV